ncbi:MAG TPA: hypothetical protein VFE79_26800 [Paraburkholderia sp.]|jgi:hypothetical protein|nr:hypothetical protein [Paraburkholderia sp.]
MVAAVAGAVGAGVSLYNGIENRNAANKAGQNQQNAIDSQTQLGQDQLSWAKDRYNEWDNEFQPIMDDIKSQAQKNLQPDYASINSDVNNSFNAQQGAAQRNMERYGVKPTDGATTAMNTSFGLGRAASLVAGDQQERARVKNQSLSNLESVYSLGTPMLSSSTGLVSGASSQLSNAYGNAANVYGQQAGTYGAAAGAGVGAALNFGVGAAQAFGGGSSPYISNPAPATWGVPSVNVSNIGYTPPPVTM